MANGSKMEFLAFYSLDSAIWMSKNASVHQVCRTKPLNNFYVGLWLKCQNTDFQKISLYFLKFSWYYGNAHTG